MPAQQPFIDQSPDCRETPSTPPTLPLLGFTPSPREPFDSLRPITPPLSSPKASFTRTSGYSRVRSDNIDGGAGEIIHEHEDEDDPAASLRSSRTGNLGLRIATSSIAAPNGSSSQTVQSHGSSSYGSGSKSRRVSTYTVPRVPVGAKSPSIKSPSISSPPTSANPLLSSFPGGSSAENSPDLKRERVSFLEKEDAQCDVEDVRKGILKQSKSEASFRINNDYQQFIQGEENERIQRPAPSMKSAYESDFRPTEECPTARDFYISRWSWLSISLILLSLFSCIFSGLFLVIAFQGPRWDRITTHGPLTPSDANTLTSVLAKLIELSFVTCFVAFLGQVLSRRAFMKEHGRGITLAEMSMWRWVVQPGTLITHWETARYAGVTVLGILSLLSAVLATLYAPASTALVQPALKFGEWESRLLAGRVQSQIANPNYVTSICSTPIRSDDEFGGSTCLQIEHAAQGYHNYQRYLAYWTAESNSGNGSTNQTRRPPGFALFHENTSVTPSWINVIDTKDVSKKFNRPVHNVSLAFPHAGVFQAVHDPRNGIVQNTGLYSVKASVPSPVIHVLCANMNQDELFPIIYQNWTNAAVGIDNWPADDATTAVDTAVDELFGWTKKNRAKDYPPVFAKYPREFNTIMNHSSSPWGRDAIYLLGQGGKDKRTDLTGQYVLCQLRVSHTPYCSTRYHTTASGGTMEAICDDPNDEYAYIKSLTNATNIPVPDWKDIGHEWANSLSLNTGIVDGRASNSRLLTQLILQRLEEEVELNPALPSPAEALAVMGGSTLLMSWLDTPFVMFWNYSNHALVTPTTQYFNATLLTQQYASGGVDASSRGWMPILFLVFLMNIFVFLYFLFHHGLVTDFSEPPNLFTLAVNSPPSHCLKGSCGGGPLGRQYLVNWFVNAEGDHLFMEPGGEREGVESNGSLYPHKHHHPHTYGAPHIYRHAHSAPPTQGRMARLSNFVSENFGQIRDRLESGRSDGRAHGVHVPMTSSSPETEVELEPGVRMSQRRSAYDMLSKRRSML